MALVVCSACPALAQASTEIRIDASAPYTEPAPAPYDEGAATSPTGGVLGVNSRYLTLNGETWLPVMGEFHFSRYPRAQWEEEILKMKAAGVQVVAAYVIWIHHEEIRGQFDWTGQRDLRAFAQLCAKHGMYFEARIGPWDHAEARNGGLPDWVMRQGPTRSNDPAYLAAVRIWYAQVGEQLKGLLWKDGGPVIAIQLENEYAKRGSGAGEEHILALKQIARESGLDVPLYLVTGWDNAVVPARAVIPVFGGGYPDAPWDGSRSKLPAAEVYAFRFNNRVSANMGAINGGGAVSGPATPRPELPYFTAEIGGGIEDTYHRRPVIHPDDIGAMFPVMLGSGVNLYGTYMFQGGENPEGKLTTLQESQATGYPTDVPVKSYDFQAPLGEYGQERVSLRKLKVFQYFLNDFGKDLAPMLVHAPDALPKDPQDFSMARAAVRSRGDSGFIFLNNYVRNYTMPVRYAAQFQVRLPGGVLAVPRRPIRIPSGAYFIWPFNLHAGGVTLRYSTAQLFARIETAGKTTLYFSETPGIAAEFAFAADSVRTLKASSGAAQSDAGVTYVSGMQAGVDSSIDLAARDGVGLRIVLLSMQEAEDAWKVRIGGQEHLLITSQDFFADPDASPARIWLRSRGTPHFDFTVTPPLAAKPAASLPLVENAVGTGATHFAAQGIERHIALDVHETQAAGAASAVRLGPPPDWRPYGVAQAPGDAEFQNAAKWSIDLPAGAAKGLSELFLEVGYEGDVARLSAGGKLLTDNFYNGQMWPVGLKRYLNAQGGGAFELSILPLRKDAPVYFELAALLRFPASGQVDALDKIRLVPEYELQIQVAEH